MGRPPVQTKDHVIENARLFFNIDDGPLDPRRVSSKAKALLARGRNFVPLRHRGRLLFLPSRFAGYLHNDFVLHERDSVKNGGVTDPVLSKILDAQPHPSTALESELAKLCKDLGVTPWSQRRDYWPEISMEPATGNDWSVQEVSATIDAYLQMLRHELDKRPYQKAKIRRALLPNLKQQSEAAIELKYCNISAVLDELGLFYVPGYKPRSKYQALLRDILVRQLHADAALHEALERVVEEPPPPLSDQEVPALSALQVEPPPPRPKPTHPRRRRASSTSNSGIADRDARNRKLGKAGEEFIVMVERKELERLGRSDLAQKVTWVADENRGYDVLSYTKDGDEKWIEVKTTNCAIDTAFYLTSNELETAALNPERYYLYRVFEFSGNRRMFLMKGCLSKQLMLEPVQYRARVGMM